MKRMSLVVVLALSSVSGMALAAGDKMPQTSPSSGAEVQGSGSAGSSTSGGSVGSSTSSGAAGSSSSAMPSFSQADADSNGAIDKSEAGAITGLDMSSADSDSDGKLSRTEYEAATLRQGSSGSSSGSRSSDTLSR